MIRMGVHCCCCYSVADLETLCSPELNVYKLICNIQGLKYENTRIAACLGCCKFLKKIHHFSAVDLVVEPYEVESSYFDIKMEKIDEICKVEVDFDAETVQQISESHPKQFYDEEKLIVHKTSLTFDCDKPHKCSECSFETTTWMNLKEHAMRRHSDERPFSCGQCNYCAKIKNDLIRHMKTHLNDCDKPYKCSECSYSTITSKDLRRHAERRHSDERPFACDQCNYSAKIKKDLISHMKNMHTNDCNKPYKCDKCSYTTATMISLEEHTTRKHDERPFSCDQCNYCAKTNKCLVIHKRIHLNNCDKPHKCSECSYTTITLKDLKIHFNRRHNDERPYGCDQCNYCAKIKKDLTNHKKKTHSINSANGHLQQ